MVHKARKQFRPSQKVKRGKWIKKVNRLLRMHEKSSRDEMGLHDAD
jgi:hypothetical protein